MGLRSPPLGDVALTTAKDTLYNRLRQVGADRPVFSEFMNWERIGSFAAHIGAMKGVLEPDNRAACAIVSGQAIGKLQSVANAIADMKSNFEAAPLPSVYFGTPAIQET